MFWSIISDYDLKTGLCELVDNALDLWVIGKQKKPLHVGIELDVDRQLISVVDDAGGVKHSELNLLITPGGSRNDPSAELIGIFGVGGKRAGIALGELVEIRSRYRKEETFEIDITPDWLESADWEIGTYQIPDIEPATTRVDVARLRADPESRES
jgi:sensor histidine kinase regulating citrate/malate metabolism